MDVPLAKPPTKFLKINRNKILIFSLLAIMLILVALTSFSLVSKKSILPIKIGGKEKINKETETWKTYSSPCGFSFKFPNDYVDLKLKKICEAEYHLEGTVKSSDGGKTLQIEVYVDPYPLQATTLEREISYYLGWPELGREKKVIAGYPAMFYKWNASDLIGLSDKDKALRTSGVLIHYKEKKFFALNFKGNEQGFSVWEKILSTFEFVDETNDWKTVESNTVKVRFNAPKNWSVEEKPGTKSGGTGNITIKVHKKASTFTVYRNADNINIERDFGSKNVAKIERILIDNLKATKVYYYDKDSVSKEPTFWSATPNLGVQGVVYGIFATWKAEDLKSLETLNKMLDALEFIE